jgi:putative addiction module component (TIGR02574 family)
LTQIKRSNIAARTAGLLLHWIMRHSPKMAATIEKLTQEALVLPERERAELAHRILLSLEDTVETGVEEAWETEIAKRVERIKQGKAKGRPAEDVFRDIRTRAQ